MPTQKMEEVLESLWTQREKGESRSEKVLESTEADVDLQILAEMAKKGLVTLKGDSVFLTEKGERQAEGIIRRHRLAERLLVDVLQRHPEEAESSACEFEHSLAPEVVEGICTLLGHPQECPHGRPIPEGQCCKETRRSVASLVVPVTELKSGEVGKIVYIRTTQHARLDKLMAFGLSPGTLIRLHQRYPSFVIQCDQTQLALEEAVAKDILVRRL